MDAVGRISAVSNARRGEYWNFLEFSSNYCQSRTISHVFICSLLISQLTSARIFESLREVCSLRLRNKLISCLKLKHCFTFLAFFYILRSFLIKFVVFRSLTSSLADFRRVPAFLEPSMNPASVVRKLSWNFVIERSFLAESCFKKKSSKFELAEVFPHIDGFLKLFLCFQVFPAARRRLTFFLIGYGVPAVITGAAAYYDPTGFGTRHHCWLVISVHLWLLIFQKKMNEWKKTYLFTGCERITCLFCSLSPQLLLFCWQIRCFCLWQCA